MDTAEDFYMAMLDLALELPGVEAYTFSPGWEAARVGGTWFMITSILKGERIFVLKAAPDEVQALQEEYEEITPGYHMNKRHWYTLRNRAAVDTEFLHALVADAYLEVVEALPRAKRPLGWEDCRPAGEDRRIQAD